MPNHKWSELSALKNQRILVTGGCGFLGRHIVEFLLEVGAQVRVFDIRINEFGKPGQIDFRQGNIMDVEQLKSAIRGCFAVIHAASPAPTCGIAKLFHDVNVVGTSNVIAACRSVGCTRLVYTSSASVVFDGKDQQYWDEDHPVDLPGNDPYINSKSAGEKLVLEAADSELATVSLRPHGIFGPRDPHLVPKLVQTARDGKHKFIIGDGANLVDFTFVRNVVYAHLLAACALGPKHRMSGEAYFITNRAPVLFWDFLAALLDGLGYTKPSIRLPFAPLLFISNILEKLGIKANLNRQAVTYAGTHHYYNCEKAVGDWDYRPVYTLQEGIDATVEHFSDLANLDPVQKSQGGEGKSSSVLGKILFVLLLIGGAITLGAFTGVISSELTSSITQTATTRIQSIVSNDQFQTFFSLAAGLILVVVFLTKVKRHISGARHFDSGLDIDCSGKTALVTGGNKNIGFETAVGFAARGANVIIACRSEARASEAVHQLAQRAGKNKAGSISYVKLDLSDMRSVKAAVHELRQTGVKIDFLINNAGAALSKGKTADGKFDVAFATNYLGHFLLTELCQKHQLLAAKARIINVSSMVHHGGKFDLDNLQGEKDQSSASNKLSTFQTYQTNKLLQILHVKELQRRLDSQQSDIVALAVHPGIVASDFKNNLIPGVLRPLQSIVHKITSTFEKSAAAGAQTTLFAALCPLLATAGGAYCDNCAVSPCANVASEPQAGRNLFDHSIKLIQSFLN